MVNHDLNAAEKLVEVDPMRDLRRLLVALEQLEMLAMCATTERYEAVLSEKRIVRTFMSKLAREFLAWSKTAQA